MGLAPIPTPSPEPAGDPSMDDILASIRRILSDDEKAKPEPPADDVLMLDPSMMVPESVPVPAATPSLAPVPVQESPIVPDKLPASFIAQPPAEPPPAPPPLVAPEAAAAAASSVGALMRTLATERSTAVHRNGPTIEDLVREEMRPMLKEWLDHHLPPLVERLVQAEIERVVNRMAT